MFLSLCVTPEEQRYSRERLVVERFENCGLALVRFCPRVKRELAQSDDPLENITYVWVIKFDERHVLFPLVVPFFVAGPAFSPAASESLMTSTFRVLTRDAV